MALVISYVKADGAHSHDHAPAPAPEPSYGAPETSYGEPVSYEEEGGSDIIIVVIVAILALVGLSLLFPTFVRIDDVGRRKRYAKEIERTDFIGRTNEIYDHLNEVLEPVDRKCIEKITCEVGTLSYDAGITSNPFFK